MMGPTHRMFGALCGAATATTAGQQWEMIAMTSVVATATAHGWSSPDVDQTELWVKVRKVIPHPVDDLLNHRALTHWWGLPALAWWGIQNMPVEAQWPAFALLIGWVSHLLGDVIFGKLPVDPMGRWTFGLGLDTDGFLETGRARVFGRTRTVLPFGPTRLLIAAALVWTLAGMPTTADLPSYAPTATREGGKG